MLLDLIYLQCFPWQALSVTKMGLAQVTVHHKVVPHQHVKPMGMVADMFPKSEVACACFTSALARLLGSFQCLHAGCSCFVVL